MPRAPVGDALVASRADRTEAIVSVGEGAP